MFKATKQGYRLCKMIKPNSKKTWYPAYDRGDNVMPSFKSMTKTERVPGKRGLLRLAMLDKLFMNNITDIMSTGTEAIKMLDREIDIIKVQVTVDYQFVRVYYVDKNENEISEETLQRIAGLLRHELSILRLMGRLPRVVFVKDRQEALVSDVDRCLKVADYGDDFVPTDKRQAFKPELSSHTKLSPEMRAKIKELEELQPDEDEPVPEMTHSVYGLHHEKIMRRLLTHRKKTKDAWDNLERGFQPNTISYRVDEAKSSPIDLGQQRKELAEFLLKRQQMRKKLAKEWRMGQKALDPTMGMEEVEEVMYMDGDYEEAKRLYEEEEMRRFEEELNKYEEELSDSSR